MRYIIGLTGNSGSGKTTTGEIIKKLTKAYIVNADSVVRDLSEPGSSYYEAIKNTFGKSFFDKDNNLIRSKLADEIYNNKESLEKLNNLTFKFVVDEIKTIIDNVSDDVKIIVIDAPLLFESGLNKLCDKTIGLVSSKEAKIRRIIKRDKISEEVANSRLSIQKNDKYYIKNADYIIENENEEELEGKIAYILKEFNIF